MEQLAVEEVVVAELLKDMTKPVFASIEIIKRPFSVVVVGGAPRNEAGAGMEIQKETRFAVDVVN
jgi:hypothetical protein